MSLIMIRIIALATVALAIFGAGFASGFRHEEKKLDAYKEANDKAVAIQHAKSNQATADLKIDAEAQQEVLDEEHSRIIARRDLAISILRERPERGAVNPGNPAAQPATDGRSLSRPDAGFLEGLASAAAVQQAERNACIAEYAKVKATLDAMRANATK